MEQIKKTKNLINNYINIKKEKYEHSQLWSMDLCGERPLIIESHIL